MVSYLGCTQRPTPNVHLGGTSPSKPLLVMSAFFFPLNFVFGSIGFVCDEGNSNVTVTFQEQFFSLLTVLMPWWPRMFSPATNANCLDRPKFHSCYIPRKRVNIFKRNNKKKKISRWDMT